MPPARLHVPTCEQRSRTSFRIALAHLSLRRERDNALDWHLRAAEMHFFVSSRKKVCLWSARSDIANTRRAMDNVCSRGKCKGNYRHRSDCEFEQRNNA